MAEDAMSDELPDTARGSLLPTVLCHCVDVVAGSYDNIVSMRDPATEKWVCIDTCIASAIGWLWHHDVQTLNSCCGHGRLEPSVIVAQASVGRMNDLNIAHDPQYPDRNDIFLFRPHPRPDTRHRTTDRRREVNHGIEIDEDDDGWTVVSCICGGMPSTTVPDPETAADVYGGHCFEAGRTLGRAEPGTEPPTGDE